MSLGSQPIKMLVRTTCVHKRCALEQTEKFASGTSCEMLVLSIVQFFHDDRKREYPKIRANEF